MNSTEHFFDCPYCGENISMLIDLSLNHQKYIEDCEVCCHPIEINLKICQGMVNECAAHRVD